MSIKIVYTFYTILYTFERQPKNRGELSSLEKLPESRGELSSPDKHK